MVRVRDPRAARAPVASPAPASPATPAPAAPASPAPAALACCNTDIANNFFCAAAAGLPLSFASLSLFSFLSLLSLCFHISINFPTSATLSSPFIILFIRTNIAPT